MRAVRERVGTFVEGVAYGAGLILGVLSGLFLWHFLGLPVGWVFAVQQ